MSVKDQPPQRKAEMEGVLTLPPAGDRPESVRTVDVGHGRLEPRNRTTREARGGSSDWPGLAPVCAGGRHGSTKKTGTARVEVVSGVTSRSAERATPGRVLERVRGHWAIAHTSHWGRDVPGDEERSQGRGGSSPPVLAARRHTAIGLLRWAGHTTSAAACRRLAAQPAQALALIGIAFEN